MAKKSFSGGLIKGAIETVSEIGRTTEAIVEGVRTAMEFHAIDTYKEANRLMGYKTSKTTGKAIGGGESTMKPKLPGQSIRGRSRHDEFGMQFFTYQWQRSDDLRVGPLSRGGLSDVDKVHDGGRSYGRMVFRDRYVHDRKKKGKGFKRRPSKEKYQKYYRRQMKSYGLHRGQWTKPGYVISSRQLKSVDRNRYELLGQTGNTARRPYLQLAANKMAPKLQQKINREVDRAMKYGKRKTTRRRPS